MSRRIAVLGSGSWGTALAIQFARAGRDTIMWGIETHEIESMARERRNTTYLPDAPFPERLSVTTDLDTALAHAEDYRYRVFGMALTFFALVSSSLALLVIHLGRALS